MDINSDLEPLAVYNYEVSSPLDTLIRHVLKTIPDSYAKEFPSVSVFEAHSPWGAHVDDEGTIVFDPSLLDMPEDVIIGTVAHEWPMCFSDIPPKPVCGRRKRRTGLPLSGVSQQKSG